MIPNLTPLLHVHFEFSVLQDIRVSHTGLNVLTLFTWDVMLQMSDAQRQEGHLSCMKCVVSTVFKCFNQRLSTI